TAKNGTMCPVCKRKLTVGVEHRVQELAKNVAVESKIQSDAHGAKWIGDPVNNRPPYVSLVPLLEIVAEALLSTTSSQKVKDLYDQLVKSLGTEFDILLRAPVEEIEKRVGTRVAEGVRKVRERNIVVIPGFDGEYGVVKIWNGGSGDNLLAAEVKEEENSQLGLF